MAPSCGATTSRMPPIGLWRTAALLAALSPLSPISAPAQEESTAPESQEASRYGNKLSASSAPPLKAKASRSPWASATSAGWGRSFGLGAPVDKAYAGNRAFIAAGALFWHPLPMVRLDIAPGVEWVSAGDEEESAFRAVVRGGLRFRADGAV